MMRRFWVFPLFFAGLSTIFHIVLEISNGFISAISLRFEGLNTDVFYSAKQLNLLGYLTSAFFGCVVGLIFAALDFALHPEDPRGDEARRHLMKSWLWLGVAMGIALLKIEGLHLGLSYWISRHRYHAYDSESQISDWLSAAPPLVFLLLVAWSILKTLQRPRLSAN